MSLGGSKTARNMAITSADGGAGGDVAILLDWDGRLVLPFPGPAVSFRVIPIWAVCLGGDKASSITPARSLNGEEGDWPDISSLQGSGSCCERGECQAVPSRTGGECGWGMIRASVLSPYIDDCCRPECKRPGVVRPSKGDDDGGCPEINRPVAVRCSVVVDCNDSNSICPASVACRE